MKEFKKCYPNVYYPKQEFFLEEGFSIVKIRSYNKISNLYVGIDKSFKIRFFLAFRSLTSTDVVFKPVSQKNLKYIKNIVALLRIIPTPQKWLTKNPNVSLKFEKSNNFTCTAFIEKDKILSEGEGVSFKDAYHIMLINHYLKLGLL